MTEEFDFRCFRERERARRDLESILPRASLETVRLLFSLLRDSPDPDQALNLLERLLAEGGDGPESPAALFSEDPRLLHHAISILGHSYWLGEALIRNPDILLELYQDQKLERARGCEEFRERLGGFRALTTEHEIAALLARFKKREFIRVALRDVLGFATLAETTAEISSLADVLIETALHEAEGVMSRRFEVFADQAGNGQQPPAFAVLALGKLGGQELNYNSDVDLIYLHDDPAGLEPFAVHEYFLRQAQLLTEILSRPTAEGAVFRVDLRLRPQGGEGELAVGLRRGLRYYRSEAQDWELQALIKARCCAGDAGLARRFIQGVEDQIYTRDINFQAIETALDSRRRVAGLIRGENLTTKGTKAHKGSQGVSVSPMGRYFVSGETGGMDVKLDRGGIRDIEFLVQCLQRVYGGEERWLRSAGTLFSLQMLHDKGHISGREFHDLTRAYEFLRVIEHRLQLQRGQQVHRLPSGTHALEALFRAVNRDRSGSGVAGFLATLKAHMASVTAIYGRVVHSQKRIEQEGRAFQLTPAPAGAARELSFEQLMQRIALDAPELHAAILRSGCGQHARRNLHRFLSSAMTSPERYAALVENPAAVERAMELFESSEYLTDLLVRHPEAIRRLDHLPLGQEESLFETAQNLSPQRAQRGAEYAGKATAGYRLPQEKFSQAEEKLTWLRRDFRGKALAQGARDLLWALPVYESLQQSSLAAEEAIAGALHVTGGEETLAVFALGRLGTREFDVGSDADLLFCRHADGDAEAASLQAEKLVHALAAYTREGTIFAVDSRLRPRGGEGELVITPEVLEKYLEAEAQPWEALTYTKLRFIAGDRRLAQEIVPAVKNRIVNIAAQPGFTRAAAEMRMYLEKSNRYERSFKLAAGGFYDIDFLASYLMLQSGRVEPENTGERLQRLQQMGRMNAQTVEILRDAARLYRTADHAIRLVTGRPRPELPAAEHARAATESLVNRILNRPIGSSLQNDLDTMQKKVREIFLRMMTES